jgi:hypothetical protein
MIAKKKMLRLERLRALAEEQHRMDLQVAASALRRTEDTLAKNEGHMQDARREAGKALQIGSRSELRLAATQSELAARQRKNLSERQRGQEAALVPLRERYFLSRQETEQLKLLREALQAENDRQDDRRSQMEMDDRYAAAMLRRPR